MSIIKKLADKYDPSLGGAVGMMGAMAAMAGAAGVVVCAAIGAGVGAVFGAGALAGAVWGAGIVAVGTVLTIGAIIIPQLVVSSCYKHELKKHVAAGGDTSGWRWVSGIENLRPGMPESERLRQQFSGKTKNKTEDADPSKSSGQDFKNNP